MVNNMRDTLKMMKSILEGYHVDKTLDELIYEYQQNQSSYIIAYIFVNNYGLFETIAMKYRLLDNQDIASFSLQELDKALMRYTFDSNCKFTTFLTACLNNRLKSEQECLFHNIRRANYFADNIEELYNTPSNFEFDLFDLNDYNLSQEEKQQVKLLLHGYSAKELALLFNVTKMTIYKRNKKIGKKILNEV